VGARDRGGENNMIKKTPNKKMLNLKRETILKLTGDMLKQVAGGQAAEVPDTKDSHCASHCINCAAYF
jgi:hypothetical protein